MRSVFFSFWLSLALVSCVASTALAQDFEAAGKHFSAAQDAFGKKHYKTAASEFEAAYSISKDPVLLFNIGESWERAGDGDKASASYKQYLAANPDAQDRGEVGKRLAAIDAKHGKLVDQSAPDDVPPAVTPPSQAAPAEPQSTTPSTTQLPPAAPATPSAATTPDHAAAPEPAQVEPPPTAAPPGIMDEGPMSKMRVAAWVGVGSTLALLAAGAILGLAAQSRSDEISRQLSYVDMTNQPNKYDMPTDQQLAQLRSDGNLYNSLGITFFSLAAASAVVTTVLFVVDAKRPKVPVRALRFAPSLDKHGAGFAAAWSF